MAGTLLRAVRKAASCIAAIALIPARSGSLFLAGRASFAARCLSSFRTINSAFGIVKLSRTSLGFFAFGAFSSLATGLQENDFAVKKGAVWRLRMREREGGKQTLVVTVQSPEVL